MSRPRGSAGGWRTPLWVALLGCLPVLAFLGSAPLRGSSEARYARVAQLTALEPPPVGAPSRWLVPRSDAGPHLTKPPLQYALMAGSMRLLGATPGAARLPGALAAAVAGFLLAGVALRLHGARVACVAAAVLALTPLHVAVARVATTDALLALCSLATLCGGLLARTRAGRPAAPAWLAPALFHGAVAAGLLTKGPVALLPAGLALAWLALPPRDAAAFERLRPLIGLPLAAAPLLAWAAAVAWGQPGALSLWWAETAGRVGEGADHPRPWWYLLPFFAFGLLPGTALLPLAWPRAAWGGLRRALRSKSDALLLGAAAVAPLLLFSAFAGKLPTYVLPCAAPLAWCVGLGLRRRGSLPAASSPVTLALLAAGLAAGAAAVAWDPTLPGADWEALARQPAARPLAWLLVAWAAALCLLAAWWVLRVRRRPPAAGPLAGAAFSLIVAAWVALAAAEGRVLGGVGLPRWLGEIEARSGLASPEVWTAGFDDPALPFHGGHPTRELWLPMDRRRTARLLERERVLAVRPGLWPAVSERFSAADHRRVRPLGSLPTENVPPPWSGAKLFLIDPKRD